LTVAHKFSLCENQYVVTPKHKNILKGLLRGFGLLLLSGITVIIAPLIIYSGFIIVPMIIYRNDARDTEAQVRSTMNPDDLRKWAWEVSKKYPDNSLNNKPVMSDQLPEDLPRLGQKVEVSMTHDEISRMDIIWKSHSGLDLQLIILLNADGSPRDVDGYNRSWAPGMYFHTLHK
jgi:hypothetical protein